MDFIFTILIAIIIGLIPAFIASGKGRDFLTWWFFGAALFIVALPLAILVSPEKTEAEIQEELIIKETWKCPNCAETIKIGAKICRFCGRELPEIEPLPAEIKCPYCNTSISLTGSQRMKKMIICRKCNQKIDLRPLPVIYKKQDS